ELPSVRCRFLGLYLQLYLGWTTSSAFQCDSGMGTVARHGHEPGTAGAIVGHTDQRDHDRQQGLDQIEKRSRAEIYRAVARVLWPGYVRGTDDGHPQRQCRQPFYRLDHWPCAFGSVG